MSGQTHWNARLHMCPVCHAMHTSCKAALGRLGGPVHLARAPPSSAMTQQVSEVRMQVERESHHDARGPMSGTTMTQVRCGEEAELSPAPN